MYKRVHTKRAYNKGKKILLAFVILLLSTSVGYSVFQRKITVNMTATAKIDVRYQVFCELEDTEYYTSLLGRTFNINGNYDNAYCDVSGDLNDPYVTFYTELYGGNNTSGKQYAIIVKNIGDGKLMLPIARGYEQPSRLRTDGSLIGGIHLDSGDVQIVDFSTDPSIYNKNAMNFLELLHSEPILIDNKTNQTIPTNDYSDVYTGSQGQKYFVIDPGETMYLQFYVAWVYDEFYLSSASAAELGVSYVDGITSPDYAAAIEEHYDLRIQSLD